MAPPKPPPPTGAPPSGIRDNDSRGTVGDFLQARIPPDSRLSIVSAQFTLYGFEALKASLSQIYSLRFLFGEPRFLRTLDPDKTDKKAFNIEDEAIQLTHRLEQAGGRLWRYLEPAGRRLLPVRTPVHALGVGLIWGWLPCGLVYSVLVWAMSAGGAAQGALLMLSFGVGTLPALLAMGVFAAAMARVVRNIWWRRLAGALVILFGVYQWSLLRWPL